MLRGGVLGEPRTSPDAPHAPLEPACTAMSSSSAQSASAQPGPGGTRAELEAGLKRLGYEGFRPGQREAIETLLSVGRLLLVAPTGGGKSLTFQLPATLLPGTTLVVSPLVSLMADQVAALAARGVAASYLAATLPADEVRSRMRAMGRGELQILYVAPERLAFEGFRSLLADMRCPLIAVDEAHCISEWGHDFRPEYMQIGDLIASLPQARVLACTATATPVVRDEILARLGLPPDTPQVVHGFARPNLALRVREVESAAEKVDAVDDALAEALGRPRARRAPQTGRGPGMAIIYAPTRRSTDAEAARLAKLGWLAQAYHAGMSGADREAVQQTFAAGGLEVVVATNAFGMGIDRPDVRLVAHLAPPGSIEAYYQEVGRAGRDGEPAIGQLLVSPGDLALRRSLMERDGDPDSEIAKHKWNMYLELMRWAEGGSCRHDTILRYFGDEAETLSGCGRCDVCVALGEFDDGGEPGGSRSADGGDRGEGGTRVGRGSARPDAEETTLVVRKALSGVARVHGRYGMGLAARLLKGLADDRLQGAGLCNTSTFGVLSERSEDWLLRLLRRCVTAGWVDFRGGDRPVVVLTEEGGQVMYGKRPVRLLLPAEQRASRRATKRPHERRTRARPPRALGDDGDLVPPGIDSESEAEVGGDVVGRRWRRGASGEDDGSAEALGDRSGRSRGRGRGSVAPDDEEMLDEAATELFEALRHHRLVVSRAESVPPYVVASDRTLRDIARRRPATLAELQAVHGIGPAKAERFGPGLLGVVTGEAAAE